MADWSYRHLSRDLRRRRNTRDNPKAIFKRRDVVQHHLHHDYHLEGTDINISRLYWWEIAFQMNAGAAFLVLGAISCLQSVEAKRKRYDGFVSRCYDEFVCLCTLFMDNIHNRYKVLKTTVSKPHTRALEDIFHKYEVGGWYLSKNHIYANYM